MQRNQELIRVNSSLIDKETLDKFKSDEPEKEDFITENQYKGNL